jgi:hypothetical protein
VTLLLLLLFAHRYPVEGLVIETIPAERQMVVAHRPVADYMPAMTMPSRAGRKWIWRGWFQGRASHLS